MIVEPITPHRWLVAGDPRLLDWCAERIPHVRTADGWHREGAQAIGVADDDDIIAVMVVHGYSALGGNCEISLAATHAKWASRPVIGKLLSYPFNQLACHRITTVIPSTNERAIKFNLGIGFQQEGCVRRGFRTSDAIILGLLREDVPAWSCLAAQDGL